MAKFLIVVEDTDGGVSVSVDNHQAMHHSAAGRVARSLMNGAKLVSRIPVPVVAATTGCTCEMCEAERELRETNPTIH